MFYNRLPLSYAVVRLFADNRVYSSNDVVAALEQDYEGHRLLNERNVEEVLATAKENGLLDVSGVDISDDGSLRISYQLNDYGREMIERYL